jgi:cysteine-rich repeat protein
MRALACASLLALACAGCGTRACKDGTLLVDVTFNGGIANGTQIAVDVSVGNAAPVHSTLSGPNGAGEGTIEVDFPSGYPAGSAVTVTVTVTQGASALGRSSATATLAPGCSTLQLALGGAADMAVPADLRGADLAGVDLAAMDLAGVDLAGADLAVPVDMASPIDMAGADLVAACGNGVRERGEACDDGNRVAGDGCDPSCAIEVGPHDDFDVAFDGSLVAVRDDGTNVLAKCWDGNGRLVRDWFTVFVGPVGSIEGGRQSVVVSRGGAALVSWLFLQTPNNFSTRTLGSAMIRAGSGCTQLVPVAWPVGPGGNYVYDTAIDAKGDIALLYQAPNNMQADVFLSTGNSSTDLVIDATGLCTGNYAIHVAFDEVTGAGVVSCQHHQANPIYFRRFTSGWAWADPAMVMINETANGNSSWYESHQIGMNDQGLFVVEWENATAKTYEADFFDPNGKLLANLTLGPILGMQYYDGFRFTHQHVPLDAVTNFVLRSSDVPVIFWRYTPTGAVLGSSSTPTWQGQHLRTGGTNENWIDDGARIGRDQIGY